MDLSTAALLFCISLQPVPRNGNDTFPFGAMERKRESFPALGLVKVRAEYFSYLDEKHQNQHLHGCITLIPGKDAPAAAPLKAIAIPVYMGSPFSLQASKQAGCHAHAPAHALKNVTALMRGTATMVIYRRGLYCVANSQMCTQSLMCTTE